MLDFVSDQGRRGIMDKAFDREAWAVVLFGWAVALLVTWI